MIGAVNVIISLYYYLSVIKEIYFRGAGTVEWKIRIGASAQVLLFLLVLGMIGIGIFQEPILHVAKSAAQTLF